MPVATNILVVGALIFVAHFFTGLFSRTRVPDVLLLTIIGVMLGPVLHLVRPENFGSVGPVFAAVTLVIILFEAGLSLDLDVLRGSIRTILTLTLTTFFLTMLSVGIAAHYLLQMPFQLTLMLGAIVGSTSPAVIVPLTRKLRMRESTKTVLFLESAFSDVLSIVVTFGFVDSFRLGKLRVGPMIGQLIATLVLAGIVGAISAIAWSALLRRIRGLENSMFTTPAFVFVLFGVMELLGYSGYVAAAVFGAVLGNMEVFHKVEWMRAYLPSEPITLEKTERDFLAEVVFLLKTFFFVYVGVSIRLGDPQLAYIGLGLTALIFAIRIPSSWIALNRATPKRDAALVAVMSPKGLAAVVLASIPMEQHVSQGDVLQAVTYGIVFLSIVFTSVLSFLIERTKVADLYTAIFHSFGAATPTTSLPAPSSEV